MSTVEASLHLIMDRKYVQKGARHLWCRIMALQGLPVASFLQHPDTSVVRTLTPGPALGAWPGRTVAGTHLWVGSPLARPAVKG